MPPDQKRDTLRQAVADLIAREGRLEEALGQWRAAVQAPPEAAAAVQRFHDLARAQREALAAYLADSGGDSGSGSGGPAGDVTAHGAAESGSHAASGALQQLFTLLNDGAIGYTTLHAMAMRLFEPPLRELIPHHSRAYAEAAQAINQLLPGVVAWELAQAGLNCACTCPMCIVGACGCVAVATETVNAAWREAVPQGDTAPGFALQPPRPGSQLAEAGIQGGGRILAVDGEAVGSFHDVQAALRKHQPGEEVQLRIQHGADEPTDIVVTRADT